MLAINHAGMNHLEGGWPRDVDPMEASQVLYFIYCTVLYCTVLYNARWAGC